MKQFIVLLIGLLPIVARGEIYFREGVKWVMSLAAPANPNPSSETPICGTVTYALKNSQAQDGESILGLFDISTDSNGNISSETLMAKIKVEDNRVYYMPNRQDASEWLLMYDFGLLPGEGCYLDDASGIHHTENPYPQRQYIKCVALEIHPDYPELETMWLQPYEGETDEMLGVDTGIWYKGVGAFGGVLNNDPAIAYGGGGSALVEVLHDSQALFKFSDETRAALWYKALHYNSGVQQVEAAPLRIRVDGMDVTVTDARGSEDVRIYTEQGALIGNSKLAAGIPATFHLTTPGIYIVNVGTISRKILAQ